MCSKSDFLIKRQFLTIPSQIGDLGDSIECCEMAQYLTELEAKNLESLPNSSNNQKDSTNEIPPIIFSDKNINSSASISLEEKIREVVNRSYVQRSISKTLQGFQEGDCVVTQLKADFQKNKDGELEVHNMEKINKQKAVVSRLMDEFKSVILSGKPLTQISLPVCIFEPRSMLERISNMFLYSPNYLSKAAQTQDALEQFKLSICYWVASLHTTVSLGKPFNPILGETFEAKIGDSSAYLEQVSHHPPICAFQLYGNGYRLEGSYEFIVDINIAGNAVKSGGQGYPKLTFQNTKRTIYVNSPLFNMSGIVYGNKTCYLSNKMLVFDLESGYYTEINFDDSQPWFKKRIPKDIINSSIWKVKPSFVEKLKNDMKKNKLTNIKFKPEEDALQEICKVEGSWLEYLNIDNKRYWTFGSDMPAKLSYPEKRLASDCNFRLDVLHLKAEDEKLSQQNKVILEEIQRNDRKLRLKYQKEKRK